MAHIFPVILAYHIFITYQVRFIKEKMINAIFNIEVLAPILSTAPSLLYFQCLTPLKKEK